MQLQDKSGIACDLCNSHYRNDFTYFSMDCKEVISKNYSLNDIIRLPTIMSFDICSQCFQELGNKVVLNYKKKMNKFKLVCEISGEDIIDKYYYGIITKAEIILSNQPSICIKCKTVGQTNKPCVSCGNKEFIKIAQQILDNRHLEINISDKIYKSLVEGKEKCKNNKWEAK